jgi:hypothetical protein
MAYNGNGPRPAAQSWWRLQIHLNCQLASPLVATAAKPPTSNV